MSTLRVVFLLLLLVLLEVNGFRTTSFPHQPAAVTSSWLTRLSARKPTGASSKESSASETKGAAAYPLNKKSPSSSASASSSSSSPSANPAKLEALQGVLHSIERSYGKGSILKLGESPSMTVETFPSGSMTLDMALGGGYPKGRVIEIYGPESSGKTTLALHAAAEIQKQGGMAAFIDAEHALDPVYARNLGVNVDELFVCQPDSGEMALDVVDQLVRSSAFDLIVIDSVAALVPRVELEGDMQDAQMGLQARLMSKALRKITGSLSRSQTTVLFLNQLRSKIGVLFGNPEVTAGGNALKFYASVRLDIRRKEILKDNQGINARVKVVKNKVAPPFRSVDVDIFFGSGMDTWGSLVDAAETMGILTRRGSWYFYGDATSDERIAQGRRAVADLARTDPVFGQRLERDTRQHWIRHIDAAGDSAAAGSATAGGAASDEDATEEEALMMTTHEADTAAFWDASPTASSAGGDAARH